MKLELKHLAPYLPYQVLVGDGRAPFELTEYNFTNVYPYITSLYLRPISCLTKEIDLNFEMLNSGLHNDVEIIDLFCYENINTDEPLVDLDLNKLPHECVEYMFRNHYDFFGLIEAGLAIDINTINK
jgi:hypothetical protein